MVRILRWAVPIAILAVAALLRFWALGRPGSLVFDELYYVRDAISQLTHGFPTVWPDDDPSMAGDRATAFTAEPSNAVHPPLGKWLIGLGILLFGPGSGWGWRSAAAAAGDVTVGLTMRHGCLISRSQLIAWIAGLMLALDGVHVTLSRVGLLDGFLTMFIVLGALLMWCDHEQVRARWESAGDTIMWRRPWLLAAALAFGAAAAVKWSGLYPLAFFLVLTTVYDTIARFHRARDPQPDTPPPEAGRTALHASAHPRWRASWRAALQAGLVALIALPAAIGAYLISWIGWIITPGGWGRESGESWLSSLWQYHVDMLAWHSTLSAPHPYQSHPLTWPLALKPTAMYESDWGHAGGCPWTACVSGITPLPNPLVTWAGVIALGVLVWLVVRAWRARGWTDPIIMVGCFVVVGYLSGWLPWVLTFSRSAVFQFYAVVLTPFSALALGIVLGLLCGSTVRGASIGGSVVSRGIGTTSAEVLLGRRLAVAVFLSLAAILALYFFPVWSGMPIAEWFWRAHLWLPWWS